VLEQVKRPIVWGPQQTALFDWIREGRGSTFMQARAGTGKTTTLMGACEVLREIGELGSVAMAAFNTKIVAEVKEKLALAEFSWKDVNVNTFHGHGYKVLRKVYDKAFLDTDGRAKRDELLRLAAVPPALDSFCTQLLSLAKNAAIGVFRDVDDFGAWMELVEHHDLQDDLEDARDLRLAVQKTQLMLHHSNDVCHRLLNFDDMIYVPVLKQLRFWQHRWVMVDEAQDTNAVRRAMARMMLRGDGRSIWVGDDRQAIYGFTGADADCLKKIQAEFGCDVHPLTLTYRCAKRVVAEAQKFVPDIEAHEGNELGVVRDIREAQLLDGSQNLLATDAILCRKTAPLVSTAFALIKRGVACHVEGRDIGAGLLKLARRWKNVKTIDALRSKLEEWCEKEVQKHMEKKKEVKAEQTRDRVDTLLALMEGCPDLACVEKKIVDMFADGDKEPKPTLTLSTVHRSKGREWPRVFVLGRRQFMPSTFARQQWQLVQEDNLIYVATTRAKSELVYVDVDAAQPSAASQNWNRR
jgi:DNA helicase-2/ATP-dependent DNA helicase PcrA